MHGTYNIKFTLNSVLRVYRKFSFISLIKYNRDKVKNIKLSTAYRFWFAVSVETILQTARITEL
jgi:hypothetical protein